MRSARSFVSSSALKAILVGGLAAAVLDALDAVVAYRVAFGMGPLAIYQFVASGMLGPGAFKGGLSTGMLGLAVHVAIAFSAAAVFTLSSTAVPWLRKHFVIAGSIFGVGVFAFMNLIVIPLSEIPPSPISIPLLINGILGHVLLVGLPIAVAARRFVPSDVAARRGAGRSAYENAV